MAAQKSKKSLTKKNSRISRIINTFNPTTKRGMLMLYLLVFAVVGGGYLAYQTFAASYPPSSLRQEKLLYRVNTSDGVVTNDTRCLSTQAMTGYGPLVTCIQFGTVWGAARARMGAYSPVTKTFVVNGEWHSYGGTGYQSGVGLNYPATKCKNMDYYFLGQPLTKAKYLNTAFGPTSFGQIYRHVTKTGWQVKSANMNFNDGNCYPSGNWTNATAW